MSRDPLNGPPLVQLVLPGFMPSSPHGDSACARDPMQRIRDLAERVAPVNTTVLISGESGVGKERLARWLHQASPRRHRPFVAINCGAFPEGLLESELFGHARGAFTGAAADRVGVFEAAHEGTLFLDEIGEVSPALQVRLLRVLQEREIRRVGETRTRRIDVRVVAATNRDLPTDVRRGAFRTDLYYRLRVVELVIPPLRERPTELRELLGTLLPRIAGRLGRPVRPYTPEALACLLAYRWPGNIRELEHALERACVVATGEAIDLDDLPEPVRVTSGARDSDPRTALAARERAFVETVVARLGGDRRRAAAELGISLSTLKRRLKAATLPRVRRTRASGSDMTQGHDPMVRSDLRSSTIDRQI